MLVLQASPVDGVPFLPTAVTILLLAMLVLRELLNGLENPTIRNLVRVLNVSVIPLLIAFTVLVIIRVIGFLA